METTHNNIEEEPEVYANPGEIVHVQCKCRLVFSLVYKPNRENRPIQCHLCGRNNIIRDLPRVKYDPKATIRVVGSNKVYKIFDGKNVIGRKRPGSIATIQIETNNMFLSVEHFIIEKNYGSYYVKPNYNKKYLYDVWVDNEKLTNHHIPLKRYSKIRIKDLVLIFEVKDKNPEEIWAPCSCPCYRGEKNRNYFPERSTSNIPKNKEEKFFFKKLMHKFFGKGKNMQKINSCVCAPSDVERGDLILVQVYLYKDHEIQEVYRKATMVDASTEFRQYKPLEIPIKIGDIISVQLKMRGAEIESDERKELIWHGSFTGCEFPVHIPKDYPCGTLLGTVNVFINDFPVGEMLFKTNVVSHKISDTFTKVEPKRFDKVFVSYCHKDHEVVRPIVEGLRITNSDYFYDRHTLKGGDKFREVIKDWIENSDVFVLCWSENAAKSVEVEKEKKMALEVTSREGSHLRIYPISIKPEASLPEDMIDTYNFSQLHP